MSQRINVQGLRKDFTLHLQGGLHLPILSEVNMQVSKGECVVIHAPSGAGKSTLLRCLYANYRASAGSINILHGEQWVDLATAEPQQIHAVRHTTLGFVTQFLRVIPRVPTLDLVAEPLLAKGWDKQDAVEEAKSLLARASLR